MIFSEIVDFYRLFGRTYPKTIKRLKDKVSLVFNPWQQHGQQFTESRHIQPSMRLCNIVSQRRKPTLLFKWFPWRDRPGARVRVVQFRKSVVGDWRFDYLTGNHLVQSQVKSCRQMMVFMSLVLVLIGQFCRDVIGRQNVKVVVIGRLLLLSFFDTSFVYSFIAF